jgi:hypothetical protein
MQIDPEAAKLVDIRGLPELGAFKVAVKIDDLGRAYRFDLKYPSVRATWHSERCHSPTNALS